MCKLPAPLKPKKKIVYTVTVVMLIRAYLPLTRSGSVRKQQLLSRKSILRPLLSGTCKIMMWEFDITRICKDVDIHQKAIIDVKCALNLTNEPKKCEELIKAAKH